MKSLSLAKPHLIVMVGVPGAGKSFFAEHFAETFMAPLVSWNRIRDELFNEPTFSKDEQEIIGRVAAHILGELFKTQRTILYEGETHMRTQRQALQKKAAAAGYETLFIWVQTDMQTTKARAKKAGLTPAQHDAITKRFTAPNPSEPVVVISGKHTYASQLKIVLRKLVEPRAVLAPEVNRPAPRHKLIR